MTKRIQFTVPQLDYLTKLVEDNMARTATPRTSATDLLAHAQDEVLNKIYEGYDYDENGNMRS